MHYFDWYFMDYVSAEPAQDYFIDDGFGNRWWRWCMDCGGEMQVVRPGKVQCPRGCESPSGSVSESSE